MRGFVLAFSLSAGCFIAALTPAWSVPAPMALCRTAAVNAADKHGIPREVMIAITLVETRTKRGGHSGPWPWTVNVAGKGRWFDSRAGALLHAQAALERGQNSFDVGCFQLNYRWHGAQFQSIDQMFEPGPSGDYAARFLKSLHAETGDWIKAAGLYHSRTVRHATRYRGLVAATVRALGTDEAETEPAIAPLNPGQSRRSANAWPLARLETGTAIGAGQTPGAVGLGSLRRAGGALLRRGQ